MLVERIMDGHARLTPGQVEAVKWALQHGYIRAGGQKCSVWAMADQGPFPITGGVEGEVVQDLTPNGEEFSRASYRVYVWGVRTLNLRYETIA